MTNKQVKIFLLSSLITILTACGGATEVADNGGISGTGITMGRITKFGSIYVNGVRFNIDNATFTRDGVVSVGQEDFSIGEYVTIKGTINTTKSSGVATEVSFTDLLEGAVTMPSSDGVSIEILGQTVKVDSLTTFKGFTDLSSLVAGNIVEVSGIKDADGLLRATSVNLKQESFVEGISENELKGVISSVNSTEKTLMINNILVDYSSAELKDFNSQELQAGQAIEINSKSSIDGGTLIASKIELEDEKQEVSENTKLEIEGVVTRFISSADFDVNGQAVQTTANTEYKKGTISDIQLNALLEVKGKVNGSSILIAEKIEFEEANENQNDGEQASDDEDSDSSDDSDDSSDSDSEDSSDSDSGDDSDNSGSGSDSGESDSDEDSESDNSGSNTDDENDEGDSDDEAEENSN